MCTDTDPANDTHVLGEAHMQLNGSPVSPLSWDQCLASDNKLKTTVEYYCRNNSVTSMNKSCSSNECCNTGTCRTNTGSLNLEINECPCGANGSYVSNATEEHPKTFTGRAIIKNAAVNAPSCTIIVWLQRPGYSNYKKIQTCGPGATSCSFSFQQLAGEYSNYLQPKYGISADAVDCCLPKENTEVFANLSLAKVKMKSANYPEGFPGCYWSKNPEEAVSYSPSCLTPVSGSISTSRTNGPVRAAKTDPMEWLVEVSGPAVTAKLQKAWWYGYPEPASSKKARMCKSYINNYRLNLSLNFAQCGLTVSNDKIVDGVSFDGGNKAECTWKPTMINYEENLTPDKDWVSATQVRCTQTYHPTNPPTQVTSTITTNEDNQFAGYVCEEEFFHRKQACGAVGWDQGGFNYNKAGRFGPPGGLDGLNSTYYRTIRSGETPEQNEAKACEAAALNLRGSVYNKWLSIITAVSVAAKKASCYRESSAKKAIGMTFDTVGGFHYECAYPGCPANPVKPVEP